MPGIFSSAIFRVSPQLTLLTMGEYSVVDEDANNPFLSIPSVEELKGYVQRAELAYSNRDKIELEPFVLHFSIVVDAPCTLCYMGLCEKDVKDMAAEGFLDQIRTTISSDNKLLLRIASATRTDVELELYSTLRDLTMEFNQKTNPNQQARMTDLQRQVDEVKNVMSDNVVRIMERGERLENIDHRTEALAESSQTFKTTARRVQRHMCLKNLKWTIILGIVVTLILVGLLLFILDKAGVFDKK